MSTILVNQDLCNRCGICSSVCTMGVIEPADENTLPCVQEEKAVMCIRCGHCEVHCPTQALLLNERPDERVPLPAGAGNVAADTMGYYLRKRRSVRHFTKEPVPRDKITEVLDIARYAASGCNGQPVEWIVVHDTAVVRKIAGLTIDWMKTLVGTDHPMNGFVAPLVGIWDAGYDVICRGAPHLLIAHIPEGDPLAEIDAIIALTHFDIAAPSFGIGTCWAGFVAAASRECEPLREELAIPEGRIPVYAMMFGHPQYRIYGIPRRKPLLVTWR